MTIILIKLSIAILLCICSIMIFLQRNRLAKLENAYGLQIVFLLIIFTRIVPFILIYLVLGQSPTSDVPIFFKQAWGVIQGKVIYRDIWLPYSPLFPYILAILSNIWQESRSIVLTMVVIEALAVVATYLLLPFEGQLLAATLYLFSPASFVLTLLGGQEDVWLWLFGLLLIIAIMRFGLVATSGIAIIGLLSTKALFILPVIALVPFKKNRVAFLGWTGSVGLVILVLLLYLIGPSIFIPLSMGVLISPPNIWFTLNILFNGWLPLGSTIFAVVGLIIPLAIGTGFSLIHSDKRTSTWRQLLAAWVVLFISFMIFSPGTLANYIMIYLLPCYWLAVYCRDQLGIYTILSLSVLSCIQPSLWYRLGSPSTSVQFFASPISLIEFLFELVMLVLFVFLLIRCWHWAKLSPEHIRGM